MSLEWARARALLNEARLRALARAAERQCWTEVPLVLPVRTIIWCEPEPAHSRTLANDGPAANDTSALGDSGAGARTGPDLHLLSFDSA